jgi:iron complex outermembrane recepter protein
MDTRQTLAQARIATLAATTSCLTGLTAGVAGAQQPQAEREVEEIVVTGSRIVRRDFTAASPILTVGQEQFENISTIGVETALNQYPQFVPGSGAGGPGAGTQFGTTDVQSTAANTPGISVLNLRGLGPNRNLVLVNGRRAQPANANLVVDVNTIPAAAIESVEVITGGASAVYGADAIGGVVNFKLREDFEGVAFDLQTSGTDAGGGEETRVSALLGGNFVDDRGNAMVGVEWAQREAVRTLDRDFYIDGFRDPGTLAGGPSTYSRFDIDGLNPPNQAAVDALFPGVAPGTVNVTPGAGPLNNLFFNDDGSPFISTGAIGYQGPVYPQTLQFKILENGNLAENFLEGLISSPLERYSVFARSTFALADSVRAFVQGNFTSVQVDQILMYSPSTLGWGASVPNDGRAIPPDLQTLLDSRPDPTAPWALTRDLDFIGPRTSENRNRMFQILTGVEGTIGATDWTYEAYYSYGETTVNNALGGFASTTRLTTVLEAPNWGQGWTGGTPFLGFQADCTTGLPVFEDFVPSQDCIDAVTIDMTNTTEMEQQIAEANFQGGIVELPGGELRGAFGVSWRKNTVQFTPDPILDAEQTAELPVGLFASNDTGGSTDVNEIYGELLLPVTRAFSLELGARSSDYDTTGRVETYKTLFEWAATDALRVRGGRQVANRAPNTSELFQGRTQLVVGLSFSDPCAISTIAPWGNVPGNPNRDEVQALCSAIINAPPDTPSTFDLDPNSFDTFFGFFPFELESEVGNPNVQNEEAETYTLGVVWSAANWSLAVDWYDIDITDAIAAPSAETVYQQCFNADGTSNPTYAFDDPGGFCSLVVRDPVSGGRLQVNTTPINIGGIKTSGVDVQLNWNRAIGPGSLFMSFLVNYLDRYETTDTPTSPFRDAAGTLAEGGQFDYRLFGTANYASGNWSAGMRLRHLPSADDASFVNNPQTTIEGVGSYTVVDVFGSYQFNDSISLRAGIDNLFDPDPEIVGRNPGVTNARGFTNPGFYDVLGRRLWLGVNMAF